MSAWTSSSYSSRETAGGDHVWPSVAGGCLVKIASPARAATAPRSDAPPSASTERAAIRSPAFTGNWAATAVIAVDVTCTGTDSATTVSVVSSSSGRRTCSTVSPAVGSERRRHFVSTPSSGTASAGFSRGACSAWTSPEGPKPAGSGARLSGLPIVNGTGRADATAGAASVRRKVAVRSARRRGMGPSILRQGTDEERDMFRVRRSADRAP